MAVKLTRNSVSSTKLKVGDKLGASEVGEWVVGVFARGRIVGAIVGPLLGDIVSSKLIEVGESVGDPVVGDLVVGEPVVGPVVGDLVVGDTVVGITEVGAPVGDVVGETVGQVSPRDVPFVPPEGHQPLDTSEYG